MTVSNSDLPFVSVQCIPSSSIFLDQIGFKQVFLRIVNGVEFLRVYFEADSLWLSRTPPALSH
jgi:hypothetical protein